MEPEEHCLTQYALKCVRRGLPIHMDKPAGEDYESFHEILKTAKAKGVPVHMGYMYRYNPAIKHCVELVKAGKLGEILSVETAMNTGHPDNFRTWIGTFKAGSMYIFGCHMIDLILTIQGMPKRILPFQKKTFIHGIDVNDSGFALLEYEKGYSSVRINSAMVNGWGQRQLLVNGTEGTFEIKPLENPIIASISTQDMVESPFRNCKQPLEFKEKGRYDDMMLEFAEMVAEGKPNPYPFAYELALHRAHLIACGEPLEWKGAPKL